MARGTGLVGGSYPGCRTSRSLLLHDGGVTMILYRVTWEIDIEANSHEEAAIEALQIHRDENSIATMFLVTGEGRAEWIDVTEEMST